MTQVGQVDHVSRREEAKSERRLRIVKAAVRLSSQAGLNGFSMRELAKEAGVSHATPFNLFGSKAEVISHIFTADLEGFIRTLQDLPSRDDIDRLFDMIALATDYFRNKAGLYRALHTSFLENATDVVFQQYVQTRMQLFVDLVTTAQTNGLLRPDLSPGYMSRALYGQWEAPVIEWARGISTLEWVEAQTGFGFAALLSGFATGDQRERLHARMVAYQTDAERIPLLPAAQAPEQCVRPFSAESIPAAS